MNNRGLKPRRVVITSFGICSSLGSTEEEIIASFRKGKTTFRRPPFDDDVVVAPMEGFDIKEVIGPFKERRYLNRGAQLSVAAAVKAVKNSGIGRELAAGTGLFVGAGPNLDIGAELPEIASGAIDSKGLMALWILRFLPNTAASLIARFAGIHGENLTVGTACTATLQAIGEAFRKIRDGYLDTALAGGGDSRMSKSAILAYKKAGALSLDKGDPLRASRPFDESRGGFVPGEGSAFFLLEEQKQAIRRGAVIYGEICGFGASLDGYSMTAPDPSGRWEAAAVRAALQEAHLSPQQIDLVAAHGTGTILNDAMEADLLHNIYGEHGPPVIALKSWIGHLSVACGAVELALCLTMMRHSYIPEIRNLDHPCHGGVNFLRKGVTASPQTVVVENFGFGGQNSALVVKVPQ